jgi:general secretion pathway protein I
LSRSTQPEHGTAGFTLIEVLIALAVVAVSLSSIGMLIATTVRGTHSIERHLIELETTRAILAALPERDQLAVGTLTGERDDHRWRIDVLPLAAPNIDPKQTTIWLPQAVAVTVLSPGGGSIQIDTIRLHRRTGE